MSAQTKIRNNRKLSNKFCLDCEQKHNCKEHLGFIKFYYLPKKYRKKLELKRYQSKDNKINCEYLLNPVHNQCCEEWLEFVTNPDGVYGSLFVHEFGKNNDIVDWRDRSEL